MRSPTRFSRFESLERRQLLAAEFEICVPEPPSVSPESAMVFPPPQVIWTDIDGNGEWYLLQERVYWDCFPNQQDFGHHDFLQRHGDRVYSIDPNDFRAGSTLFVFAPDSGGVLTQIVEVPLDF